MKSVHYRYWQSAARSIGLNLVSLHCSSWFSQCQFHSSHKQTGLCVNTLKYPDRVSDHFRNVINAFLVRNLDSVAKYCDEYACLWVCGSAYLCVSLSVREYISGTTRAIFTKFLCTLPMSVARSSSDMFTIGRIAYRREWVFFPIDNAYNLPSEPRARSLPYF